MTDKEIANYKRRLYYAANKQRVVDICNAWIERNPTYRKEYYQRNKERIKAYNRAKYQRNKALLAKAKALLSTNA
jgi:hypothetical protein